MTIHNATPSNLLDQSAQSRRIRRMLSWGRIQAASKILREIDRSPIKHVVGIQY